MSTGDRLGGGRLGRERCSSVGRLGGWRGKEARSRAEQNGRSPQNPGCGEVANKSEFCANRVAGHKLLVCGASNRQDESNEANAAHTPTVLD